MRDGERWRERDRDGQRGSGHVWGGCSGEEIRFSFYVLPLHLIIITF
jgi:hypothetical protein